MLVSFNPNISTNNRQQRPAFKSSVLNTTSDVYFYLTKLPEKPKITSEHLTDLQETIRKTEEAGRSVIAKALRIGAKQLGLIE